MGFIGNSPTAMREVARLFSEGATLTNARIQILEQVIRALEASVWGNWVRPYIEMLRQVIRTLTELVQLLQRFMTILNQNALQQEAASSFTQGTSPTSGTRGGSLTTSPQAASALQNLANLLRQSQQSQQSMQGLLDSLNTPTAADQAAAGLQPATGTQPLTPAESGNLADGPTSPATSAIEGTPETGVSGSGGSDTPRGGGGGGPDSAAPPTPGQLNTLNTPLAGPQGAVLAAPGLETGEVNPEAISLNERSDGLAPGVLAGVAAVGAAGGMWASNRFGNQATDGETTTVTT